MAKGVGVSTTSGAAVKVGFREPYSAALELLHKSLNFYNLRGSHAVCEIPQSLNHVMGLPLLSQIPKPRSLKKLFASSPP